MARSVSSRGCDESSGSEMEIGSGSGGGGGLLTGGFAVGLSSLARRCGVCLASFPSAWLLERHAILQHAGQPNDDKPFTCEQCGQRYRYRSAYVKHREQNHRARLPADKLFTCDVCGMQFRYLKSFKKHRLNHALERLQRAPESAQSVLPPSAAERSDQVSSTGEPMQSDVAGSEAPSPVNEQEQGNTGERGSERSGEKETATGESGQRRTEMGVNSAEVDMSTPGSAGRSSVVDAEADGAAMEDDRGEPVVVQTNLGISRGHDVADRRERRFACPFCGKCVRSKENLKLHVRKHTGERPFVCLFCGRAFGGKSDLTRHLRIHTGERPYHCEMCGKCFARADYLSKHLTTHIHHR